MMSLRRYDLPLDQTAASRLLPWALAGLVYVAVVALAVAAIADGALRLYGMRAKLVTVTLPAVEDVVAGVRGIEVDRFVTAVDPDRFVACPFDQGVPSAYEFAAAALAGQDDELVGSESHQRLALVACRGQTLGHHLEEPVGGFPAVTLGQVA